MVKLWLSQDLKRLPKTGELSPGEMKSVLLGQEAVLLANVDGNFYVIGDICTHRGGTLSDGDLDGSKSSVLFTGQNST